MKTVLITGASSGIGKAFAMDFANRGMQVVLVARSEKNLLGVAGEIKSKHNIQAQVIVADLSKPEAAQELYNQVEALRLDIDILVNNAGFGKWGKFEDFDVATYRQMLQLNINTLTELCYLYLPKMRAKSGGGIINVASSAALLPVPYASVYSATKSYVLYFSEALYGELLDTGVTVTCLCPSGTKTNFADVANSAVAVDEKMYQSPAHVAKAGIEGFMKQKNFVLTGKQKNMIVLAPRILSRKAMIKQSTKVFKRIVDTQKA